MSELLRKIRGLLGIGVTWGVLWGLIGALVGTIIGLLNPWVSVGQIASALGIGLGLFGVVSGVGFGLVLSLKEGRKTLLDLSLPRMAALGVIGAALVPLFFGVIGMYEVGTTAVDVLEAMLLTAGLGGVFAPATVAVARRAELRAGAEPPLLDEPE